MTDEFESTLDWAPNTLYVLDGDVVVVPDGTSGSAWDGVEKQLGCTIVLGSAATEPWVLRRVQTEDTPLDQAPREHRCMWQGPAGLCTYPDAHTGAHSWAPGMPDDPMAYGGPLYTEP